MRVTTKKMFLLILWTHCHSCHTGYTVYKQCNSRGDSHTNYENGAPWRCAMHNASNLTQWLCQPQGGVCCANTHTHTQIYVPNVYVYVHIISLQNYILLQPQNTQHSLFCDYIYSARSLLLHPTILPSFLLSNLYYLVHNHPFNLDTYHHSLGTTQYLIFLPLPFCTWLQPLTLPRSHSEPSHHHKLYLRGD